MQADERIAAAIAKAAEKVPKRPRMGLERTHLAPDAPAPALNDMIAAVGLNTVESALSAWDMKVRGEPLTDIAHAHGMTIEGAKRLLKEAHDAIHEDLKSALEQNRTLDLERIDGLIRTYYPMAKEGDEKAANVTLKCLERRAKLVGTEPDLPAGKSHPENVLVWIQAQLPQINRLVDALPAELAPGAPS